MKSQSAEAPTLQEHADIRRKYVQLAWELWRSQQEQGFFVWHPIPEEHLRIEVVMFWRGQISHIHGWNDIIGQVTGAVVGPIKSFMVWVWENLIQPGVQAMVNVLEGVMDAAIGAVKWVVDGISTAVAGVTSWLASVGEAIYNVVQSIAAQITSAVSGILSKISEGLNWLAGELTKATSWIWDQVQGFFSALGEVLKEIGTWIINAIKKYVIDPLTALLTPVFEGAKLLVQSIFTFLTGGAVTGSPVEWRGSTTRWLGIITGASAMVLIPLIGAKLLDLIHPLKDPKTGEIIERAIQFSGVAFLQAAFFTTYFDVACARPVRQELNAIFMPEIPSIGEATRMLWRQKISAGDFDQVVKLHGYADPWASGFKTLTENLPGSGDLILFVVREVIEPAEFTQAMGWQGFSKYWADAYWEAHWILPPAERTRTAFLRKLIPEAEYRKFLIWYDFKPDPRPGIKLSDVDIMLQTQYDWPGRVEARWMLEWGQITDAEAEDMLKAAGLDPAWAPRVARAYLLNQLRDEYNRVRTVLMTKYKEGFLKPEPFKEALAALNFATHTIEATLKWADEAALWDDLWEQAQEWWRLAKAGKISPEKYAEEIRALGMVETRITSKMKLLGKLAEIKAAEGSS